MKMTRTRIDRDLDERLLARLLLLFLEQQISDFFPTSVMEAKSRILQFPKHSERNVSEQSTQRHRTRTILDLWEQT